MVWVTEIGSAGSGWQIGDRFVRFLDGYTGVDVHDHLEQGFFVSSVCHAPISFQESGEGFCCVPLWVTGGGGLDFVVGVSELEIELLFRSKGVATRKDDDALVGEAVSACVPSAILWTKSTTAFLEGSTF